MEKFAVWFGLLLKKHLCKKTTYIQSLIVVMLILFIQMIQIPDADNVRVGVFYDDSIYAERIYEDLSGQTNVYRYVEYDDTDLLEMDVISGKLECGFIFSEDFDDDFEEGNVRKTVTHLCTPMSAKSELIRENFYIAFLTNYSEIILKQSEEELYENTDSDRSQKILDLNEEYLDGDELFDVEVYVVETEEVEAKAENKTYPVQGLYGILIFLFIYFSYNGRRKNNASDFRSVLNKRDGFIYDVLDGITAGIVPTMSGMVCVAFSADSRGILCEFTGAMCLLVLSIVWIIIFSAICQNELNYMSAVLTITILQLLICPVFWDFASSFDYLKYFRYLFPLGIYLSI